MEQEIELEDGTVIVYSHVAPIPKGHIISAAGVKTELGIAMAELHPKYLRKEEGSWKYVEIPNEKKPSINLDIMVLKADEIIDDDDGITYKETY